MARMSAAERRRALVDAAVGVLVRDGVSSVTTRAVVAEAGMTLGAFHYCFASKQELLREVSAAVIEREVRAGLGVVRPGRDIREVVREALHAFLREVRKHPAEQLVLFEVMLYALRTPGQEDLARLHYDACQRAASRVLLQVAADAGAEVTVELPVAARTLIGLLDGLTLAWLADRDDARAEAQVEVLADCVLTFVRPRHEPSGARPDDAL